MENSQVDVQSYESSFMDQSNLIVRSFTNTVPSFLSYKTEKVKRFGKIRIMVNKK
jgi:hypothetical protein